MINSKSASGQPSTAPTVDQSAGDQGPNKNNDKIQPQRQEQDPTDQDDPTSDEVKQTLTAHTYWTTSADAAHATAQHHHQNQNHLEYPIQEKSEQNKHP